MKEKLQARFKEMYKDKRLLAVQLNGFTHSIFFDDGDANSKVECVHFSHYMDADEKLKYIFSDVYHYAYKHNPLELIYILPNER